MLRKGSSGFIKTGEGLGIGWNKTIAISYASFNNNIVSFWVEIGNIIPHKEKNISLLYRFGLKNLSFIDQNLTKDYNQIKTILYTEKERFASYYEMAIHYSGILGNRLFVWERRFLYDRLKPEYQLSEETIIMNISNENNK